MRKSAWLILVLTLCVLLAGCAPQKTENQSADMFMTLESYGSYGSVVVDTQTGVMYYRSNTANARGMLTLLVNADGSPRVWNQE